MDKKKVVIISAIAISLVVVVAGFATVHLLKKDALQAEQELEQTIDKYGVVEKETVEIIVAKFNTEIMDNGLNTPASDDYMVTDSDTYWFGLTENVSFYLKPIDFTGNIEKDILDVNGLQFDKTGYDKETALTYVKYLIKANNQDITDSEIDNLLKEAQEKSASKTTANNGKGISVGLVETDDTYDYQVIRLYK